MSQYSKAGTDCKCCPLEWVSEQNCQSPLWSRSLTCDMNRLIFPGGGNASDMVNGSGRAASFRLR
jgi:hypothetical protein